MYARAGHLAIRLVWVGALLCGLWAGMAAAQQRVGPSTNLELPRFVSIKTRNANLRRGPGFDYRVDFTYYAKGQPMLVIAEYDTWRRVRDPEGVIGWMHVSQLSSTHTVIVAQPDTVLLRRPASTEPTARRAVLQQGVLAELNQCENGWCQINVLHQTKKMRGWVVRNALWGVTPPPFDPDPMASAKQIDPQLSADPAQAD